MSLDSECRKCAEVIDDCLPVKSAKVKKANSLRSFDASRQVSTTPKGEERTGNSSSSTTLLSVMQRVSPAMFHISEESKLEKRKTPFGIVKVRKKGSTAEHQNGEKLLSEVFCSSLSWGDQFGTRGLVSVRQRIKGGKIHLTRDGLVILTLEEGSMTIAPDGEVANYKSKGESQSKERLEDLYRMAALWLKRYRHRCTLAGFMLPAKQECSSRRLAGAVEYIAYCSVKANGPLPDYQVSFAAIEISDQVRSDDEWNVQLHVQIQRDRSRLILYSRLYGTKRPSEASWKECVLPIKLVEAKWILAGNSKTSLIVEDLSKRERKAIERSLEAAQSVDIVFSALIGERKV